LVNNQDRYLILWGGRGSSKTDFIAKKLIFQCISSKYFRHILIRNNYNSIKDSQYQTIKDIIFDLRLESLFNFRVQPFEIECTLNGNKFIARGCDDTTKLKSVKDPTGAWYEEDIPSEADFITITTSIRTGKADYLQEIFTINPEVEGNYEDNWFWQRFFKGKVEKNFSDKFTIDIDSKPVDVTYTSHHSTYHNNRWLPVEFKAFLEDLKQKNAYYYTIYTLGEWGNKISGSRFYRSFDRGLNTTKESYSPHFPLHISFDFNVRPYMSLSIWQVYGKKAIQVDEICGKDPINNTIGICNEFIKRYMNHSAGLFVYGDPAGFHDDTRMSEKGHNDFYLITSTLSKYNPRVRVPKSAPSVVSRGNFINQILSSKEQGCEICINEKCAYTIMDLVYLKENTDGTKLKEKTTDESGYSSEKYGHFSDGLDYFITEVFLKEYNAYLSGGISGSYVVGNDREYNFER
jgi:PBSX family phage terminase large subunit